MTLVGTREINNVEVEIHADKYGAWNIYLPEEGNEGGNRMLGGGQTLDSAITNARNSIKKSQVKVAVAFKTDEGKYGIATGRHARSHDKLLTEIGGKKEHIGFRDQTFKEDTPESVFARLKQIGEEESALRTERREIIQKWSLDLGKAVDTAIAEKVEARDKIVNRTRRAGAR
jgi:hypothetical protein